ncbi:MAG: hypothetical protein R3300_21400 [Candidatus Promineifilaceae bacterium]|nr:hypothetical protein [Candidatus Promineifilaceae bacterium]
MEAIHKKTEDKQVNKRVPEQVQESQPQHAAPGASQVRGLPISRLPSGVGTRALRQAAVLQMQRTQGNAFASRQIGIQRQEDEQSATPTAIGSGGASVKTEGSTVDVNGAMVQINSPNTQATGIVRASTIIADSVIASSYSPGAGNIW